VCFLNIKVPQTTLPQLLVIKTKTMATKSPTLVPTTNTTNAAVIPTSRPTLRPTTVPVTTYGGLSLLWLVVLVCFAIVVIVCGMTYPMLRINRWRRMQTIARAREEEEDEDEDERDESSSGGKKKKKRGKATMSLFNKPGRQSTIGKWKERRDPDSGQPYWEHTGTGKTYIHTQYTIQCIP
jgi:hypothetical protein